MASTSNTVTNLRRVAIAAYVQHGGAYAGAQAAWEAVRRCERSLRAPTWCEQVAHNSARIRSYRSPLACALAIPGLTQEFGSYCADYRRTVRSETAAEAHADLVLEWLESQAAALV